MIGTDGELFAPPGPGPSLDPAQRGLEPPGFVLERIAQPLCQRLLRTPERGQVAVGIGGTGGVRTLLRGADEIGEGTVTRPDGLDVDADRRIVPADEGIGV